MNQSIDGELAVITYISKDSYGIKMMNGKPFPIAIGKNSVKFISATKLEDEKDAAEFGDLLSI